MNKEELVRKSFRLPLTGPDSIKIEIDGGIYDAVDIGAKGIGIRVPRSDTFSLGEKLSSIKLTIEKVPFSIEGVVVHISGDSTDFYLCGILLELSPLAEKKFTEYVNKYRKKVFLTK